MRALLGLNDLTTNVNIPNIGQIPNLPIGSIVECNAVFRTDAVTPIMAGNIPAPIYPLIARVAGQQEEIAAAAHDRDLDRAYRAFVNDPLVTINLADARKLFDEMADNTRSYLSEYFR